jgi:hypothetical protein
MPAVRGGGRLQQAILASLDGVPRPALDLAAELVGGKPTPAQYSAFHRAARSLIAQGLLHGWLQPDRNVKLLILSKAPCRAGDADRAMAAEHQQIQPVPVAQHPARLSLQEFTDEAWAAFATDCGYASDIATAAVKLARYPYLR